MKLKRIIAAGVSYLCLVGMLTGINAKASYYMYTIDNDPLSSTGYTYSPHNLTYYTASGSYNGDMRMSGVLGNGIICYANYGFPALATPITCSYAELRIYLNNSNFTDPKSNYRIYYDLNNYSFLYPFDQYSAPAGWSIYYTGTGSYNNYTTGGIEASGSQSTGKYFGSDAIQVKLHY